MAATPATTKTGKPRKPRKPVGPRMYFVTYNADGPLEIFPASQAATLLAKVDAAHKAGSSISYVKLEMPVKSGAAEDTDED